MSTSSLTVGLLPQRANQFVIFQRSKQPPDAFGSLFRADFVTCCQLADDLRQWLVLFKPAPDQQGRFIQLVITPGLNINQYAFAIVKICDDDVGMRFGQR